MVKKPDLKHWIKNLVIGKTTLILPCPLCGEDVHIKKLGDDEMSIVKTLGDLTIDEVVKRCYIQNYNEEYKDLHTRPYLYAYMKQKKQY
ncbi:MAG: hypothetical protein QW327_03425 [Candidatus Odinarchaeota archaeon]